MPAIILNFLRLTKQYYKTIRQTNLGSALLPLILWVAIGVVVYRRLEGWSFLDAIYATVVTVTTVGYGDISPATPAGRLFAIFYTIIAVGFAGYAISTLAANVIERQLGRRDRKLLEKRMQDISQIQNHMIICGGGVLGNRVASEYRKSNIPFILIERDPEKLKRTLLWLNEAYIAKLQRHYTEADVVDIDEEESKTIPELADEINVLYLLEDPLDEHQLKKAGIGRARGIVAALEDDRESISVILSARELASKLENTNFRIVSAATDQTNLRRMYLAGAHRVVSPTFFAGFHLAEQSLSQEVGEFWDQLIFLGQGQNMLHDFKIPSESDLIGKTVMDIRLDTMEQILSIRRGNEYITAPRPDAVVQEGDVLIMIRGRD